MPIFEYRCQGCGEVFEELVVTTSDLVICACGSMDTEKLVSVPAPARIFETNVNEGRFRYDDATFHQSVKNPLPPPLPHDKGQHVKVFDVEFGKNERRKLDSLAQLDNL